MSVDDVVLDVVDGSSIDATDIDMVTKCQIDAIDDLEKQVNVLKSKLKDYEAQSRRAFRLYSRFAGVIMLVIVLLVYLHSIVVHSYVSLELMITVIVVWVIASLISIFKLKNVHNLALAVRGEMRDIRASAIILQGEVEEDFRTNEGDRCPNQYHLTLLRIRMLVFNIDFYHNTEISLGATFAIGMSVGGCIFFVMMMTGVLF